MICISPGFFVRESKVNYAEYEIRVTLSLAITAYPEHNGK